MMYSTESLPFEKWSALRDTMKRDWPKYAHFYNYLNKSILCKTKDTSIKDNIYCPDSNVNAGACIGITEEDVYLFSLDESKHILEEMLHKTDKIPWSKSFYLGGIHENIQDLLENFLDTVAKSKGMRHYTKDVVDCYLKAKEDCLKIVVKVPEECELRRIDEQHVPFIHSHWRCRDVQHPERSIRYPLTFAKRNGGYGLFLKEDNSLVSWTLQCTRGCLAILHTLDEHRRKGYGKIVARALMKYIAEKDDADVTVYISKSNVTAFKFFEAMGFKKIAELAWYEINQ